MSLREFDRRFSPHVVRFYQNVSRFAPVIYKLKKTDKRRSTLCPFGDNDPHISGRLGRLCCDDAPVARNPAHALVRKQVKIRQ